MDFEGDRPITYIANGSHANYATAGSQEALRALESGQVDAAMLQGGLEVGDSTILRQVAALHVEPLHLLVKEEIHRDVARIHPHQMSPDADDNSIPDIFEHLNKVWVAGQFIGGPSGDLVMAMPQPGAGNLRAALREAVPGPGLHARGGGGNDRMIGADGADRLDGGPGNDKLTGGPSGDRFVASPGQDRVTDFEDGLDRLDLSFFGLSGAAEAMARARDVRGGVEFRLGDGDRLRIDGMSARAMSDDLSF